MLEAKFPRIPGDMGNATTWPFPVLYRVVLGATPEKVVLKGAAGLLPDFVAAAQELVRLGAEAAPVDVEADGQRVALLVDEVVVVPPFELEEDVEDEVDEDRERDDRVEPGAAREAEEQDCHSAGDPDRTAEDDLPAIAELVRHGGQQVCHAVSLPAPACRFPCRNSRAIA